jgi:cyanophycinase-like exopeptidase
MGDRMKGLIALVGSGEYLAAMEEIDRFLLAGSGAAGRPPRVVCLPTAAGLEGERSWGNWNRMGEEHFRKLGAQAVGLPLIDRESANDAAFLPQLEDADLIYFSGGNPQYLIETLRASLAWQTAQTAWQRGAVCAGCSAGAMILARTIPDFRLAGFGSQPAFGILPARMILPHFDRWRLARGAMLAPLKKRMQDGEFVLGIDEETALVGRLDEGEWRVMGRQTVSRITRDGVQVYASGERLPVS